MAQRSVIRLLQASPKGGHSRRSLVLGNGHSVSSTGSSRFTAGARASIVKDARGPPPRLGLDDQGILR